MAKCYTSPTLLQRFWLRSFRSSKYLPNVRFNNLYFFSYISTYKVLFEKTIKFSPIRGRWELGTFSELAVMGDFCRCTITEKRNPSTYIHFVIIFFLIYYFTDEILWLSPFTCQEHHLGSSGTPLQVSGHALGRRRHNRPDKMVSFSLLT